jgi:GT2 family glycosyltransferase
MNPVIMLTLNNLALTKKAVASVLAQDIPVELLIMDNGSTDGTVPWLLSRGILDFSFVSDPSGSRSVAASWNFGLKYYFMRGAEYALVVNNDIELRPDTYRLLIMDGGGFVTAVGSDSPEKIKALAEPDPLKKRPHPDFSAFVIRREVFEKVGVFDEKFLGAFGEDWDYHVRLHAAGTTAICLDLPFLHWGSMTVKNAIPSEQKRIGIQADKNRAYFKEKWGMAGGSPEYYTYFGNTEPT